MGVRFDIVIASYILAVPFLIFSIQFISNRNFQVVNKIVFYYIFILFSVAFMVCAADIPYFNQFYARFSITAFEWFNSPVFVFKMIIEEPSYYLYTIPFIISLVVFYKVLKVIFKNTIDFNSSSRVYAKVIISVLFLATMFLGIRGRIDEKSPIRVGTAYFCNNPFLNQLGLNPNFTLIRSYLDSKKEDNKSVNLINDQVAVKNVQNFLNIKNPSPNFPLLRRETMDSIANKKLNVVVIMMESMSAAKMKRHGNNDNLTPFLDSIADEGYYFENTYTSGIHTFNGIFSTLFSYPALFRQHPMNESSMLKYRGMATTLKENNYSTTYFTTHDGQFDNVEGFLKLNDFENVISKKDYPSEEVKTTLGVPDDYMFEFAIPKLNALSNQNKPFFAAFMTASDHGPFYIPEYFKPKNSDIKNQIVEYADYSLKKFIQLASKQKWFNNTLFVFIADHGAPMNPSYDLALNYNHSPLIFYAPKIIKHNKVFSKMAGQIDVFPTIMGFLKLPFNNNTLGINLFTQERPYIYFNADDKYGVIDDNWFLMVRKDNFIGLYKYRVNDLKNYATENPEIVSKMKIYAESNLQSFQYVLKNKKQ
ncbi:LTA synthase family protein [Flavobacterium sp.]